MHNGKEIRGVLRDEKFGCPTGCLRITSVSSKGVLREHVEEDSKHGLRQEAADEVWDGMQKQYGSIGTKRKAVKQGEDDQGILIAQRSAKKQKPVMR